MTSDDGNLKKINTLDELRKVPNGTTILILRGVAGNYLQFGYGNLLGLEHLETSPTALNSYVTIGDCVQNICPSGTNPLEPETLLKSIEDSIKDKTAVNEGVVYYNIGGFPNRTDLYCVGKPE